MIAEFIGFSCKAFMFLWSVSWWICCYHQDRCHGRHLGAVFPQIIWCPEKFVSSIQKKQKSCRPKNVFPPNLITWLPAWLVPHVIRY